MEVNSLVKKGKVNSLNGLHLEDMVLSDHSYVVKIKEIYEDIKAKEYIMNATSCSEEKIVDSLKLVALKNNILSKSMTILSSSEIMKVELAILLINNVNTIILYQFDQYFMEKELLFFKKLLKKLVTKYGKTIVLLDSKLSFLFEFADRIVVKNERNDLEVFSPIDFYDERLLQLMEEPKIIEFIRYANKEGKKINHYTDIKELIKAIYRIV